jgi:hypothetical protein
MQILQCRKEREGDNEFHIFRKELLVFIELKANWHACSFTISLFKEIKLKRNDGDFKWDSYIKEPKEIKELH